MNDEIRPLIDLKEFGKRLKAARILAGHETVKTGAAHLRERTGITISDRTVYSLERGEHMPTVEQYFAILIAYAPPGFLSYWEPCYSEPVLDLIRRRIDNGTR